MTTTMNPDVKELWLAALESGKFQQGRHRLATVDASGVKRFCCLGVLCELAVRAGIVERSSYDVSFGRTAYNYGGATKFLPLVVERWAGLYGTGSGGNPLVGDRTLAYRNDERRATFREIAALIREHL